MTRANRVAAKEGLSITCPGRMPDRNEYNVGRGSLRTRGIVQASGMIADVPPFYVRFFKSVFLPVPLRNHQSPEAIVGASPPEPVRLLPKPEPKRLQQAATALKALSLPEQPKPDVLSLAGCDYLRTVVPDYDHVVYE
ncbi:MAG: hypothetical protein K2Y42_06630 [Hyphomicrobium sp.]|uniref:hypothetical protein n=1 Tax=Hyphomicrobium sp. TaxID=82 RepID=UPI0025C7234C|nr:hypothetical protein [Hyphomicrobium sp.]MBX9862413.1 hypothetical protein [Hyphomicrobium sp.]